VIFAKPSYNKSENLGINNETFNNQFLNVCSTTEGKTENARRTVPLYKVTYEKLEEYIQGNNKRGNDYIFDKIRQKDFKEARNMLGALLGYREEDLEKKNIRFYSGRHFFKTMLNAGGLGEDVEEYFMGHTVSSEIKKRYNHKEKIGRENLEKKIKKMFDIIDGTFF
jgi:integrase